MPSKKHYPVQRTISIAQAPGPAANIGYTNAARSLSRVNHRLYRESRIYDCSVTIDGNVADATTVDVYALADTWYLKGALKLAKMAWDESNSEEIAMNNGNVARWSDFRINDGISGAGDMLPVQFDKATLNPNQITDGEFIFSKVVDQAGVSRSFTLGNPSASEYGIFDEYDLQPGTSADPELPSTGPYSGLLPNLSAAAADHISDDGNLPPYRQQGYGDAIWVKVGTLHLATGRQRLSTGFFSAPMGHIALVGVGTIGDAADIQLTVKGGDYKGVMSHSMLE
jgi:hypothetical protein